MDMYFSLRYHLRNHDSHDSHENGTTVLVLTGRSCGRAGVRQISVPNPFALYEYGVPGSTTPRTGWNRRPLEPSLSILTTIRLFDGALNRIAQCLHLGKLSSLRLQVQNDQGRTTGTASGHQQGWTVVVDPIAEWRRGAHAAAVSASAMS
jgi:hypothetical protein